MSLTAITLDQIAAIQHVPTFNEAYNAVAAGVLFGVKQRETVGLRFSMYGGNFPAISGTPLQIADTHITLTASTTNYIYVDQSGVISKVTVAPTGWPGPMGTGYRALYQLTVGTDAITSGTCYVVGKTSGGPNGAQGATGAAGAELWFQRKGWYEVIGNGGAAPITGDPTDDATVIATPVPTPPSVGTSSLLESVPRVTYSTGGDTSANAPGGIRSTKNYLYRGNAAGRGGFDVSIRWGCSNNATNFRHFVGLIDCTSNPTNTVDPSSYVNCIGVGGDNADTYLSLIHNDSSGSATKTALANNYEKKKGSTNLLYELRLWCTSNGSDINYTINDPVQSLTETGAVSSDIPANTQFLGWIMYHNTGSGGAQTALDLIQVIRNSRY